ncbi:hypothetical protein C8R46DRAFT_668410 [Mycena filopes]|nr:hypothetical protein C8R46DRAFT_668410 [Mycena filopes]
MVDGKHFGDELDGLLMSFGAHSAANREAVKIFLSLLLEGTREKWDPLKILKCFIGGVVQVAAAKLVPLNALATKIYWILRPRLNTTFAKMFCVFANEHVPKKTMRGGIIAHGAKEGGRWIAASSVAFIAGVVFLSLWDFVSYCGGDISGKVFFRRMLKNSFKSAGGILGAALTTCALAGVSVACPPMAIPMALAGFFGAFYASEKAGDFCDYLIGPEPKEGGGESSPASKPTPPD